MQKVYRTILLFDKRLNEVVYAHSIEWILSDLDYVVEKWKAFNVGSICVYFRDLNDLSEIRASIEKGLFEISQKKDVMLPFNFPESDSFFIEQSYSEENFNPFIGLCTFAEVYFRDASLDGLSVADYLRENKEAFDDIKEGYKIDLERYPHLINTYTIFTPTRLDISFRGLKAGDRIGYEIALVDHFKLYVGAFVNVESSDDALTHSASFELNDVMNEVISGFVPDKVLVSVVLNGVTIYRSGFNLVKNITVNTNIVEQRSIQYKGRTIQQTSSVKDSFDV